MQRAARNLGEGSVGRRLEVTGNRVAGFGDRGQEWFSMSKGALVNRQEGNQVQQGGWNQNLGGRFQGQQGGWAQSEHRHEKDVVRECGLVISEVKGKSYEGYRSNPNQDIRCLIKILGVLDVWALVIIRLTVQMILYATNARKKDIWQ